MMVVVYGNLKQMAIYIQVRSKSMLKENFLLFYSLFIFTYNAPPPPPPLFLGPAVSTDGSAIYVGSNDNYIYAVDASSGKEKWKYLTGGKVMSSPSLSSDGKSLYVGCSDSILYSLNTNDGKLRWKYHTLTGFFLDSSPAVLDNFVYIGSSDSTVYAIRDLGFRADGTIDQSKTGNGPCYTENGTLCVALVKNVTVSPNVTLWLLQDSSTSISVQWWVIVSLVVQSLYLTL